MVQSAAPLRTIGRPSHIRFCALCHCFAVGFLLKWHQVFLLRNGRPANLVRAPPLRIARGRVAVSQCKGLPPTTHAHRVLRFPIHVLPRILPIREHIAVLQLAIQSNGPNPGLSTFPRKNWSGTSVFGASICLRGNMCFSFFPRNLLNRLICTTALPRAIRPLRGQSCSVGILLHTSFRFWRSDQIPEDKC